MENQHLKSCNQHLVEQVGALQHALEGKWASLRGDWGSGVCVEGAGVLAYVVGSG